MVAILDMKKPKSCIECDVHIAHDYCDHFSQFGVGAKTDGVYSDCPLIDIVTCGECKYWHEGKWYNTCDKHIGHGFEAEHFCSDGERRTDGK